MNCHYCGYSKAIPRHCPNCQSSSIRYYGTGTQKAYDELQEIFPEAKILRMDVDTTRKREPCSDTRCFREWRSRHIIRERK